MRVWKSSAYLPPSGPLLVLLWLLGRSLVVAAESAAQCGTSSPDGLVYNFAGLSRPAGYQSTDPATSASIYFNFCSGFSACPGAIICIVPSTGSPVSSIGELNSPNVIWEPFGDAGVSEYYFTNTQNVVVNYHCNLAASPPYISFATFTNTTSTQFVHVIVESNCACPNVCSNSTSPQPSPMPLAFCGWIDGPNRYDFTMLARPGGYSHTSLATIVEYNFCGSTPDCSPETAVCQTSLMRPGATSFGSLKSAVWFPNNLGVLASYHTPNLASAVLLVCDMNATIPVFTSADQLTPLLLFVTIHSKCACPNMCHSGPSAVPSVSALPAALPSYTGLVAGVVVVVFAFFSGITMLGVYIRSRRRRIKERKERALADLELQAGLGGGYVAYRPPLASREEDDDYQQHSDDDD